jgi:TonB family protein
MSMLLRLIPVLALLAVLPTGAAAAKKKLSWEQKAAAQILSRLDWPKRVSRAKRLRATVTFLVDPAGVISEATLVRKTGSAAADRAALAGVNRASPLPAPPLAPEAKHLRVTVPISFVP